MNHLYMFPWAGYGLPDKGPFRPDQGPDHQIPSFVFYKNVEDIRAMDNDVQDGDDNTIDEIQHN